MIFFQLNFCSSLIYLGEVPKNIKKELRHVVEEPLPVPLLFKSSDALPTPEGHCELTSVRAPTKTNKRKSSLEAYKRDVRLCTSEEHHLADKSASS